MYFKPQLIDKIVKGEKTQTRRVVKPGECLTSWTDNGIHDAVLTPRFHGKWRIGQTYAVCPGRGKPVVWYCGTHVIAKDSYSPASQLALAFGGFIPLRILLTGIREENASDISEADARAEGFASRDEFFATWDAINGKNKRDVPVWALTFRVEKSL